MNEPAPTQVLLARMRDGDADAAGELMPMVYDELRALARVHFRGQPAQHTLQPTALAHEAFLRLAGAAGSDIKDRAHFMAVAATAMRQILIDHARRRSAEKRGGDRARIALGNLDVAAPAQEAEVDLLALEEALVALAELDARKARVVELRFFAGLDQVAIAEALGVARSTVAEDWRFARAWLVSRLGSDPSP